MRLTCILIIFLSIIALPAFAQQITSTKMEVISGKEGNYHFEIPAGMFRPQGNFRPLTDTRNIKVWTSTEHQAVISLFTTSVHFGEGKEIRTMQDLTDFCREGIQVTYKAGGADWSVASGYDKEGKIVYRKGFFSELTSMQGRDQGEPSWVWSKAMILEFRYPAASAPVMNKIVAAAVKSFGCSPFLLD
jgi:hypothetical protein